MIDWPLLSFLIWLPMIGGFGVLLVGERRARQFALAVSLVVFLASLPLYFFYDAAEGSMQFIESVPWVDAFGIRIGYDLGVDGISIALLLLNTFRRCTHHDNGTDIFILLNQSKRAATGRGPDETIDCCFERSHGCMIAFAFIIININPDCGF